MRYRLFDCATLAPVIILTATASCGARASLAIPPPSDAGISPTSLEPASSATFAIGSTGLDMSSAAVIPGAPVTFKNEDTQPHQIRSDTKADAAVCPELDLGSVLQANATLMVTMADHPESCGFYDAMNPGDDAFRGSIQVEAAPADDGGGW